MDDASKLALETIQMDKQALVFVSSRASAEKTAEEIAKLTSMYFPELEQQVLHALSTPTRQCRRLSHCVRKGIAFHHAGLVQQQRGLIEEEFRKGTIKIICATPTLAAGLSMPAFRVIITSLKRYSAAWGMDWIPVLEYMQMAGRAGRPEWETFGESIVLTKTEAEKEEIFQRYVCGVPEEISSKLAAEPVLRTYLLSLIAAGIIHNQKSMQDFFARSFWAHQYKDFPKLQSIMRKMLQLLEECEFVAIQSKSEHEFTAANRLGKKEMQFTPTITGKRAAELYLDPLTARHLLGCLQQFTARHNHFSMLQMITHTLEMRPLLRTKRKEEEFVQEQLVKRYGLLLEAEPSAFDAEYGSFIDSIKTALFLEEWIEEKDEEFLLEKYDVRPGEIRAKIEIADWLLYAAEELTKVNGAFSESRKELLKELAKLRIRVQHGVREDLLLLLKLKGIGRVRARKLVNNKLSTLQAIKNADLTTLSQILGKAVAEDVMKQLGEEVEEVPLGRRKGQTNVMKF